MKNSKSYALICEKLKDKTIFDYALENQVLPSKVTDEVANLYPEIPSGKMRDVLCSIGDTEISIRFFMSSEYELDGFIIQRKDVDHG